MVQLMYKPVSLLASVLDGALADIISERARKLAAGKDEAPKATAIQWGNRVVLTVTTVQGAIFILVRTALDRSAAETTRQLIGRWAGRLPRRLAH
ncbi:MAG: DUF4235 domain-containing protein [Actinomycetota bacterium]|nr:DUF4235 domain-containing protein [Actinomycetota bacterium]